VLVLEDVGLLTREAAVVHRKAGALDVGARCITVAAHAVQGWGWPDTSRHVFCDNQAGYICDTLGVIHWAGATPSQICGVSALLRRRFHFINSVAAAGGVKSKRPLFLLVFPRF